MTGFGRGIKEKDDFRITVEIKSVNHRFFECSIRIPRQLSHIEDKLKRKIKEYIKRGKIDVFVTVSGSGLVSRSLKVDWDLVDSYADWAIQLKNKFNLKDELSIDHFMSNPELVTFEEKEDSSHDLEVCVQDALLQAVEKLYTMKVNEGRELERDLIHHLNLFKQSTEQALKSSPTVITKYQDRLEKRIKEFTNGQIDENRILTEVAVFAEKSDVTEEFTRLNSHFIQFEAALQKNEPIGRRLDFITQEMNREVNTIGSKANDAQLISHVVDMKSIVEKLREQVQNIE